MGNLSNQTIDAIKTFLHLSNKLKNAFFWQSPSNAASRRKYEENNSFSYEGDKIKLNINVSCSCKNIYVSKSVEIAGKKTTAKALYKFLKEE